MKHPMNPAFSAHAFRLTGALFCLFLGACGDTHLAVQAPQENTGAKSNIKTKSEAPQIERKLFENAPAPQSDVDFDNEDEATQAVLRTAERMVLSHDYVSAKVLYKRALGANPESVAALKGLARMSELEQKPQEALQAWREVIRIDNDNPAAHRGVAKNLMTLGIYDKAVDELNKLRAVKGDDVETLNLLGMAYTREEHHAEAIETLQQAVNLDPTSTNSQNNLGFAYIAGGKLHEAIALFETLVDSPRATVQHRQNLALAYGLAGRENDARKIALQDLPLSAVEKNLRSYRLMRERTTGHNAEPAAPKAKPAKKKTAKPKEVVAPQAAPETAPQAAPATGVDTQRLPEVTPPPAPAK